MIDSGALILVTGSMLAVLAAFIWIAIRLGHSNPNASSRPVLNQKDVLDRAEIDVESVFNKEFREELRNRGRMHFEKVINENAMFLQQDLRLTTSQLNEYMKQEIATTLKEEFTRYEESIADAKQIAVSSIEKTQAVIEQQREMLGDQLNKQVAAEKERILTNFEQNMAEIINHYVLEAIGSQIDLNDQLDYILAELERNKAAILEDIHAGA